MKGVEIGAFHLGVPIIQGGMGVGISLGGLAGAVAHEGGMGIISTAQIGFKQPDFMKNVQEANLRAIDLQIKKAKAIAKGHGMVGVNIMVALRDYAQHVRQAVESGADCIISGAGLPLHLPALVGDAKTKIAPIVSSGKAAMLILKSWDRKFHKTADFLVIEGAKAGGHLGFKKEEILSHQTQGLLDIFKDVKDVVKGFEEKYQRHIPIFVAGGIYSHEDIIEALDAGADGVQMGTRFIATYECDADDMYKQAFLACREEDITIVTSPVGMPGRAINTPFMQKVAQEKQPIRHCFQCISSCHVANAPYCITQALIEAALGHFDRGLFFTGANGYRIDKIVSVKELMDELIGA